MLGLTWVRLCLRKSHPTLRVQAYYEHPTRDLSRPLPASPLTIPPPSVSQEAPPQLAPLLDLLTLSSLEDTTDPSSRIYTLWEANTKERKDFYLKFKMCAALIFSGFALNIIKCSWEILVKSPYFALGIGMNLVTLLNIIFVESMMNVMCFVTLIME
ncbi:hypothetical protein Tco_0569454 [Tanacetum coccineum]